MSPINTENFIGPSPVENSRSAAANFSTENSLDESFDEHLRQAFRPTAANVDTKRHHEDSNAVADRRDDSVVDDVNAPSQTTSQDTPANSEESQDNSQSSGSETIDSNNSENQTDADQALGHDVDNRETPQIQAISADAELVEQLVEGNSQQNQQTNQNAEQNAEQQLSNSSDGQSVEIVENVAGNEAGLEVALIPDDAAQTTRSKTDVTIESDKPVDTLKETAVENTAEIRLDTEQAVDGDFVDATVDKPANPEKGPAADEVVQEIVTASSTSEETPMQDASAQSQIVVADKTIQEKNRRASDRIETNADSENAAEGDAQAAAVPSAANGTADRDGIKPVQNAIDKIAAPDVTDKDVGDSKATSTQPGQAEISLAQRNQSGQGTQTAAPSEAVGADETDPVDRVRFVQRVAKAFQGVGRDGGTLRIRLHPSELGSLRLEVTIRDGAMTARMETDTQAAKNILLDSLPALRDRLAQQDIKVQQFDIDYAGGNNDGSPQSAADQHQPNERSAGRQIGSQASGDAETESEDAQAAPRARRLGEAAQLDFVA